MFPIPWYAIILIGIPQTFLIIAIGTRLLNIHISIINQILLSVVIGVICYFTRHLTIPGVNTIALLISTTVLLSLFSHLKLWKAFLAILLGLVALGIIETGCNSIVFSLFHLTYNDLAARPWINILSFLPTIALAFVGYLLIIKKNWILYDLSRYEDYE